MKKDWRAFLLFFLLTPLTVLASGDYVLTALTIDLILFFVIVFAIIKTEIQWMGKAVLFIAYIAAMYLLFYLIDQVNYLNNLAMINIGSALFPPTLVYLTYLGIKDKFKKVSND